MEGRHAQGLGTTSLYPANTKHGEVEGQRFRRYGLVVGRGENFIFEVLTQAFSGRCFTGMTYYLKETS